MEQNFKSISRVISSEIDDLIYPKEEKSVGLSTGYENLDKLIYGLQEGTLTILAARPGVGKSTLALNIATNVARRNKSVAYFSLEMSQKQLAQRIVARDGHVSLSHIITGELNSSELNAIQNGYARSNNSYGEFRDVSRCSSEMPLYIDQNYSYKVSQIYDQCLYLKNQGKLDLIVIDYLQLLNCEEKRSNRTEEVTMISRDLKKLAQTLNVPVLALSQLSRGIESRKDKTPQLSDLRESGSIEQDADVVMFISESGVGEVEFGQHMVLTIAKNRQGTCGMVEMIFTGSYSEFKESVKNYL